MPGGYKRKKYHVGDTHLKKGWRTKRRTRDLDQIDTDLQPDNVHKLTAAPVDLDKPGLGQFYCVHCAKDFIDNHAFQDHVKSKKHKRRLHALKTEPYTIEESLRAAGMGSYVKPNNKRKMETLVPDAVKEGITDAVDVVIKKAKMSAGAEDADGDSKMK